MSKEVKRYIAEECNRRLGLFVPASEYDALLAERDALKKDAERYRWLRRAGYADIRDIPAMAPTRMDEFIDAALQGEQP